MPAELDDIELRSVQLQQSHSRDSISNACDLRRVPTDKGEVLVAIQGDISKPAILTLHDLGLNCKSQLIPFTSRSISLIDFSFLSSPVADASTFTGFFNYPTMRALLENFCVYHVTAPGQEEGAPTFPEEWVPSGPFGPFNSLDWLRFIDSLSALFTRRRMSWRLNCSSLCLTSAWKQLLASVSVLAQIFSFASVSRTPTRSALFASWIVAQHKPAGSNGDINRWTRETYDQRAWRRASWTTWCGTTSAAVPRSATWTSSPCTNRTSSDPSTP